MAVVRIIKKFWKIEAAEIRSGYMEWAVNVGFWRGKRAAEVTY